MYRTVKAPSSANCDLLDTKFKTLAIILRLTNDDPLIKDKYGADTKRHGYLVLGLQKLVHDTRRSSREPRAERDPFQFTSIITCFFLGQFAYISMFKRYWSGDSRLRVRFGRRGEVF
jgi:hypothetical protein